jgi:hypothetical protein
VTVCRGGTSSPVDGGSSSEFPKHGEREEGVRSLLKRRGMRNGAWRWSSPRDIGSGDSTDTGQVRQSPVAGRKQKSTIDVGEPLGRSGAGQGGSRVGRIRRGHWWLPALAARGNGDGCRARRGMLRKEGGGASWATAERAQGERRSREAGAARGRGCQGVVSCRGEKQGRAPPRRERRRAGHT